MIPQNNNNNNYNNVEDQQQQLPISTFIAADSTIIKTNTTLEADNRSIVFPFVVGSYLNFDTTSSFKSPAIMDVKKRKILHLNKREEQLPLQNYKRDNNSLCFQQDFLHFNNNFKRIKLIGSSNLKKAFRFSITTITNNNVNISSSDDFIVKDNIVDIVKIGVEYVKGKERIFKEFDKHSIVKSHFNNDNKELEFTLKTVGERAPPSFTKNIVIYFNCFSLNSVNEKQEEEVILLKLSLPVYRNVTKGINFTKEDEIKVYLKDNELKEVEGFNNENDFCLETKKRKL
ncbi:hypothetical protein ABK040_000783 [Willaertia magna]